MQALITSIGEEKVKIDEEVEKGREDEEAAAALQKDVTAFQEECATDLAAAEPIIQVRWGVPGAALVATFGHAPLGVSLCSGSAIAAPGA